MHFYLKLRKFDLSMPQIINNMNIFFGMKRKMRFWNQLQVIWYQTAKWQRIKTFVAQFVPFSRRHCLPSTHSSKGEYNIFLFGGHFWQIFFENILKHIFEVTQKYRKTDISFLFPLKPLTNRSLLNIYPLFSLVVSFFFIFISWQNVQSSCGSSSCNWSNF